VKHEKAWLVLGWCALVAFLFYAITQAFPPVVVVRGSGAYGSAWRYNMLTGRVHGLCGNLITPHMTERESAAAERRRVCEAEVAARRDAAEARLDAVERERQREANARAAVAATAEDDRMRDGVSVVAHPGHSGGGEDRQREFDVDAFLALPESAVFETPRPVADRAHGRRQGHSTP